MIHLISSREWDGIKRSEGVSSSTRTGYQVVTVPCRLYDGRTVEALTLMAAQGSLSSVRRRGGGSAKASSVLGVTGAVPPSQRYLGILKEGARHHGLDPEYQAWLAQVKPYDRGSSVGTRLGSYVSASTALALALPLLGPVWALGQVGALGSSRGSSIGPASGVKASQEDGNASVSTSSSSSAAEQQQAEAPLPAWFGTSTSTLSKAVWLLHDWVWSPVLGGGR